MFSIKDLNVLQHALREWKGIYREETFHKLTNTEVGYHKDSLRRADRLAAQIEEILYDFHEIKESN